ncbi:MAG: aminotransferase class I/II-fold pyridoxal phosphate-dependent enzyme [Clostridia bacterium]|nr:aminotransferase class I/II-fold pyridoxal phosphate-dependent enzyme [Clostridia bacterium]
MTSQPPLSTLVTSLPRSGIRAIAAFAGNRPGLVHLEYGEPSMLTPEPIRKAAAQAVLEERMVYTPTAGPMRLRELISEKLKRVNGYDAAPEQVFVTPGGVGALFLALAAVLNPGDAVLLPDPGWPNAAGQARILQAEPVFYPLDPKNGFLPDPDGWRIPPHCKAVVINSPANPTGAVFPRDLVERIARVAERHGLWVISDEVYDQIYFDRAPTSIFQVQPERAMAVYSFSKTYAMTGWRLGYLVAPAQVVEPLQRVAEAIFSSSSMVAQRAAEAALTSAGEYVPEMVAAYRRRRDLAVSLVREWGLYRYTPEGAFYLMVDVSAAGPAEEVARRLVTEKGVVAVPGTAFGRQAQHELRISLAASEEDIRRGLEAIRDLVQG